MISTLTSYVLICFQHGKGIIPLESNSINNIVQRTFCNLSNVVKAWLATPFFG